VKSVTSFLWFIVVVDESYTKPYIVVPGFFFFLAEISYV
jgi:hypothetical protein